MFPSTILLGCFPYTFLTAPTQLSGIYFSLHQNIFSPYLTWKLLFNHFCYYALLITTIELLSSRNTRNLFDALSILMDETKCASKTKCKVPIYDRDT